MLRGRRKMRILKVKTRRYKNLNYNLKISRKKKIVRNTSRIYVISCYW